uniref:Alpha,alpha-trehalose-phosphate synthase [UDP-forming]-like n=1 Tax=Dermatophagoides pteronyssinus TaxID=6956 RepID=A0A6P6Y5V3_DERPT
LKKTNSDSIQSSCSSIASVVVIANRLPLTVKITDPESETGYTIVNSSGGLVSALKAIKNIDYVWVGWPGCAVPEIMLNSFIKDCADANCCPVFMSKELIDGFYDGYCNKVIWPILHYVINDAHDNISEEYAAYEEANRLFAEAVKAYYVDYKQKHPNKEVILWVHDYHLMILPQILRRVVPDPNAKIAFFLHTPFPHRTMWSTIPQCKKLLLGLMHCDLVGFHIYEYQKHFMNCCESLVGATICDFTIESKEMTGYNVRCISSPIGIDPKPFIDASASQEIKLARKNLRARYNNRYIILGVDRLDYMKGVYQKLKGIEVFLKKYPDYKHEIVLIQLAVPSRQDVPAYQKLKRTVHELVTAINGTSTEAPVIEHWDQSLSFKELVAVYTAADACLISSIRDGMNLVAFEYLACQSQNCGSLLLSCFTGAERSLAHAAITFNPWDPEQIADAIYEAMCTGKTERANRLRWGLKHISEHTAEHWAKILLNDLLC